MEKLILRNFLSPGDIVMLTAAVRDLHAAYPRRFITDVRTPCPALWEHNPHLTPLAENDPAVCRIDCHYPLIHRSNHAPYHFIHGFMTFLNERLGLTIEPTAFRGDIHLSPREKSWFSQVEEIVKQLVPFWIVVAGGKRDYTVKWWDVRRYQEVVDHFAGRILFVQVGEAGHEHPPLRGVIDLRGKTDLRQLVRLVYHAQGVLCPVTLHMHLAAAVEVRPEMPKIGPASSSRAAASLRTGRRIRITSTSIAPGHSAAATTAAVGSRASSPWATATSAIASSIAASIRSGRCRAAWISSRPPTSSARSSSTSRAARRAISRRPSVSPANAP